MDTKNYYKRKLPHYHPANAVFFITTHLAGSLPLGKIRELQSEVEKEKILIGRNKFRPTNKKCLQY